MRAGIFDTVFERATLVERFEAARDEGFDCVQLDLASTGTETFPERVGHVPTAMIDGAREQTGIELAALAGTFNMIHPDPDVRAAALVRFETLVAVAADLGIPVVTLCTGTRDAESMWRAHPDNGRPDAWEDLQVSLGRALNAADGAGITLGVEPEPANVVRDAATARRLLDVWTGAPLRIIFDPANIVLGDRHRSPEATLREGIDILRDDIVMAHAKDLNAAGEFCAAGTGIVPWPQYWSMLDELDRPIDVIFHTLAERDVPAARSLLPFDVSPGRQSHGRPVQPVDEPGGLGR